MTGGKGGSHEIIELDLPQVYRAANSSRTPPVPGPHWHRAWLRLPCSRRRAHRSRSAISTPTPAPSPMPSEANLNAMNLYFDSINWTDRRPQDRDHQGGRPVQSAGRPAEGQEADRERQGRSDRRRAGQQCRARRAQLHEAAEGVLRGVRRRHRRHHLGPLSRICSAPRSRPISSARRWRSMSTTISARRSSPPPPTMPAAGTSSPNSRGRMSPRAARSSRKSGRRSAPRISAPI